LYIFWNIFRPFRICYSHLEILVYFSQFWYIELRKIWQPVSLGSEFCDIAPDFVCAEWIPIGNLFAPARCVVEQNNWAVCGIHTCMKSCENRYVLDLEKYQTRVPIKVEKIWKFLNQSNQEWWNWKGCHRRFSTWQKLTTAKQFLHIYSLRLFSLHN
jgi:hypothetical protein